MATEVVMSENLQKRKFRSSNPPSKKKNKNKKGGNFTGVTGEKKPKMDPRMKKLFRKRARDYNSDNSDEEDEQQQHQLQLVEENDEKSKHKNNDDEDKYKSNASYKDHTEEEEAAEDDGDDQAGSDDDDEGDALVVQDGITKFSEGCRAFKMAFTKITSKNVQDDLLGPVLSGHKSLIAEKLAEDESEKASVKGDAKKEKRLVAEKGHVIPANFLDSHDKFLIGVATKGVVKLFNAVNKAQNAQKGLNPSRFKDAKALGKRKKDAFFSELRKKPLQAAGSLMGTASRGTEGGDEPAWAPLRDSYMLTNSKLKNWDKIADKTSDDDDMGGTGPHDSSSDED